ncbi:hypothetical protein MML48_8g00009887 [Holotrichia oblita]|uniref:Uncharacterized protein n=1 Tax=Holotrichia oblita TaxID=644536 RepID=A0ACB9SRZ9_HOLOL|nr:hypothetical protein MML48_8g00009887 [Holotrichia oblita]
MEEDRAKKIEAGREKLALYKKKKQKRGKRTPGNSPAHSSDSSTSLNVSLPDLPENTTGKGVENVSDSSIISEHLHSGSSGSVENDRSLQEIEISNNSLAIILDNLPGDDQAYRLSQENLSPVNSSEKTDTIVVDKVNSTIANDVISILNEILCSECFKSRGDNSDLTDTNDLSINIFEGVSLDDSSINNYVTKLRQTNLSDVNDEEFNKILTPEEVNVISEHSFERIKALEKQLVRKDSEIAALSAELDSLKELTNSLSTTDYKPFHEEYHSRLVEFQNAVVHRDNLIQQLTESLQQSILNREELQQQSENFAKEISLLQKQLSETSNIIKRHKCTMENVERSPARSVKQQFRKKSKEIEDDHSVPLDGSNLSLRDDESGVVVKEENGGTTLVNLEEECAKLEDTLGANQLLLLDELKVKINMYVQQKNSESNRRFQDDIKRLKVSLVF